jgi:hypothetical protein
MAFETENFGEDFEAINKYMGDYQPSEIAPVYDSFIATAMAHRGIFDQLENTLVAITGSDEAEVKSPVFSRLCLKRYTLTGKFNSVIAGEMALETGQDLETIITGDGFHFQRTTGYFSRLPWDHIGRDGDYIDGVHYRPLRRRNEKKQHKKKNTQNEKDANNG